MRIHHRVNELEGIIKKVSKDKTEITILLPRGGTIKARNEGFETGDQVCFMLDTTRTHVIKVIPKTIADAMSGISENHLLQRSLMERPDTEEEENFDEYKVEPNEIIIEEEEDDNGREVETDPNKREIEAKFIISNGS